MRNGILSVVTAISIATSLVGIPVAAQAPVAVGYSVENTDLGTLLDDAAAKAVLAKYIPAMVNSDQISMARSMTLKQLQQYAGDSLTDETLAKIQADLAKLPKH